MSVGEHYVWPVVGRKQTSIGKGAACQGELRGVIVRMKGVRYSSPSDGHG